MKYFLLLLSAALTLHSSICSAAIQGSAERLITLSKDWQIQSSAAVHESGDQISIASYDHRDWYKASVPSTVVGTLVADGVFKNPFQGRNLDKIPDSLFSKPWWYRTDFSLPPNSVGYSHVVLKFLGINYRAEVWVNGKMIADSGSTFGGFRQFEFDITGNVEFGKLNVLAVRIFRQGPGALTLGFVDWNPFPPDRDMGLWRPVELHITGDVAIENPFVAPEVDTTTLKEAELTVSAELKNMSDHNVTGVLEGKIGTIAFSQKVSLSSNERKIVTFAPADFRQLIIKNPKLWWTHDFGKPNLYGIHLEYELGSVSSDVSDFKFGIRQVNDYINSAGFRGYKLNGKKILLRGGGWTDHIFLNQDKRNLEAQIDYAVNMHLNTIRMEGFWGENGDIFDLCDEKGILLMVGVSCQWEWENIFGKPNDDFGCIKSPEDMTTAAQSFEDEIKWLRNHPSIFVWAYGSDLIPRPELERKYLKVLSECDNTRPSVSSAAEHKSEVTGPSAVKMRGPYDYVPPVYWFADTAYGGAFGFNTETGPGPEVPRTESLKKMLSPDSLWPINGEWNYHTSRGRFRDLRRYNDAIDHRLGTPTSLVDYERKAQFTNYEGMRAMFEAFAGAKFKSTGLIQWMYNAAWPKTWWQLFDYYLDPTGAFYGAQKACEPIHVEYNSATHAIVLVNSTLQPADKLQLEVKILNFDLKEKFKLDKSVSIDANSAAEIGEVPDVDSLSRTYFLDLRLLEKGKLVTSNFYALSTRQDSLLWKSSTWFVTETSYADLTELNDLQDVKLEVNNKFQKQGDDFLAAATVHNPTDKLAFMVYLSVRKGNTGESVLPIFWDDNYFTLLPGESRTIRGSFHAVDLQGESPRLEISGWNVK
ncbi:MAG TPA: sugar-binding domain-containing protein [Candidatus Kryptonia bacterium]